MKHNYIGNECGTSVPVTTKQTKVLERGCAHPAALDVYPENEYGTLSNEQISKNL